MSGVIQNIPNALETHWYAESDRHMGYSLTEFGNAGEQKKDPFSNGIMNGSIYFGYRSPIGPLYWGVGFAEGGQRVYFLRVGNVFNTTTIGR